MENVLERYEQRYDPQEPVVCLDEKPVTRHADVRPTSPAQPGREARRDNEYQRCGTANVFCAVEPKAGRQFTLPTRDRSGLEFAQVAVTLALAYPNAKTIHWSWTTSTSIAGTRRPMCTGPKWPPRSGTVSRSITRLPTEVGSIKRRSKSGSFHGNVWPPKNPGSQGSAPGNEGLESPGES
jgi:hypothetical protein